MRNVKSWSRCVLACLTLAAGGALAAAPSTPGAGQGRLMRAEKPIRGEYLVVLKEKPGRGLTSIAVRADAMAAAHGARVLNTHETAFRGFLVSASEEQARALAEDPQVEYVQENGIVHVSAVQSPAPWNLDRIDQESLPLNNSYQAEDATGIRVYVVDTGIRVTHSEFEGRAQSVFNNVADETADDLSGHGTSVAAIIGGKTYGVAKKVSLNSVKIFNQFGEATVDGIVGGLEWVASNAVTPAIVNLSFTTSSVIGPIDAAVDTVVNNPGLVVVVAAGNADTDVCGCSPAHLVDDGSHPNRNRVITVGAIDQSHFRWSNGFNASNYGACMDLWAPGANITSAAIAGDTSTRTVEGTSFAAPHVSGVAAIMLFNGVAPASIPANLVSDASVNQVTLDPGDSSPNLLLYKRPQATRITNGVATSVSDVTNGQKNFKLDVPAGRPSVVFSISGGTGDADLYVRYGALPETYVYQCRPLRKGNNETCTFTNPTAGTWYVQLRAYSTYTTSLKGQY